MRLVSSEYEINKNMDTLDRYLKEKHDPEYDFALDLIKRGTCFIVKKTSDGLRFYPSRFIGYAENNMQNHLNNYSKHGGVTNKKIAKILNIQQSENAEMDKAYSEYCEKLGFVSNEKGTFGKNRKFWVLF